MQYIEKNSHIYIYSKTCRIVQLKYKQICVPVSCLYMLVFDSLTTRIKKKFYRIKIECKNNKYLNFCSLFKYFVEKGLLCNKKLRNFFAQFLSCFI